MRPIQDTMLESPRRTLRSSVTSFLRGPLASPCSSPTASRRASGNTKSFTPANSAPEPLRGLELGPMREPSLLLPKRMLHLQKELLGEISSRAELFDWTCSPSAHARLEAIASSEKPDSWAKRMSRTFSSVDRSRRASHQDSPAQRSPFHGRSSRRDNRGPDSSSRTSLEIFPPAQLSPIPTRTDYSRSTSRGSLASSLEDAPSSRPAWPSSPGADGREERHLLSAMSGNFARRSAMRFFSVPIPNVFSSSPTGSPAVPSTTSPVVSFSPETRLDIGRHLESSSVGRS